MSDASSKPIPQKPAPAHAGPLSVWWVGPISVLAVSFIYFASQVIGSLLVNLYPLGKHWTDAQSTGWLENSIIAQFFFILIAETLTAAGLYVLLKAFRWNWSTIGLTKPKWINVGWGLSSVIPYYVVYFVIVSVVSALVPALKVDQQQQIGFDSVHGLLPLVLTFISLVILPPLVEEIAMRGFLYTGLKKWLPRIWAAVIVSALFGAAHLAEGGDAGPLWIGAIDTFTLSLILCYLREKTGSLWAGITLHAAKNGIAFISLFILSVR